MTVMEIRKRQLAVINHLGLRKRFMDSCYGSYGWFLRSLGIIINSDGVRILEGSEYKKDEAELKLVAILDDYRR